MQVIKKRTDNKIAIAILTLALFLFIYLSFLLLNQFFSTLSTLLEESYVLKNTGIWEVTVPKLLFNLLALFCVFYVTCISFIGLDVVLSESFYKRIEKNIKEKGFSSVDLVFRGLNWTFSKFLKMLLPAVLVFSLGLGALVTFFLFFNLIMQLAGINIGVTTFICSFIGVTVFFGILISLFYAVWKYLITSFGSEICISEPDLDNETIMERSEKLLLSNYKGFFSGFIMLFWLFSAILGVFVIAVHYNPLSIKGFVLCLAFYTGNLGLYSVLKVFKIKAYLSSLLSYYNSITVSQEEIELINDIVD